MAFALILLMLGAVLIYGGIKGKSIGSLLTGNDQTDRTPPNSGGLDTSQYVPPNSPSSSSLNPTAPNQNIFALLSAASRFLGVPYKWGGNDPRVGIDCSRFVQLVFAEFGVNLGRTTYEQYQEGTPVSLDQLRPGDVIFTEPSPAGPGHEGLYVGNNQVQESPHTGEVNKITPLSNFLSGGYVGTRRYL